MLFPYCTAKCGRLPYAHPGRTRAGRAVRQRPSIRPFYVRRRRAPGRPYWSAKMQQTKPLRLGTLAAGVSRVRKCMTKRLNSSRITGSLGTGIATLGLSALLGCTGEVAPSGPPGGTGATGAGTTGGATGSGVGGRAGAAVGGSAGPGAGGPGAGGVGTAGTGSGGMTVSPPLSGQCDGNPVT